MMEFHSVRYWNTEIESDIRNNILKARKEIYLAYIAQTKTVMAAL